MEKVLIKVQSPFGSKRVETFPSEHLSSIIEKVKLVFHFKEDCIFDLFLDRKLTRRLPKYPDRTLREFGLGHGDTIFIPRPKSNTEVLGDLKNQDSVEEILDKMDGMIERRRNPELCKHDDGFKCIHCVPLDPFDEEYLKQNNISHLSFHAFLRKRMSESGKFLSVDDLDYKVKPVCTSHLPYPKGVCLNCKPGTVFLTRQIYRHVDHIVFENPQIVERFLDYWRITGHQRFGFLYGKYQLHKDVPLGIKAVVQAIYEPPQENDPDFLSILEDPDQPLVDQLSKQLKLEMVGWIFTDLIPVDVRHGKVGCFRTSKTYFLSAQEVMQAAYFQNRHPGFCNLIPKKNFGSKFVTVCITGDSDQRIQTEGYQISNQGAALVRDDCILPTKDMPGYGTVKANREVYIPDIWYRKTDRYGNTIQCPGTPFPVDFLLVNVPVSTPLEPEFTFYQNQHAVPFLVENRPVEGHLQTEDSLGYYLRQFQRMAEVSPECYLEALADFHVLLYLSKLGSRAEDVLRIVIQQIVKKDLQVVDLEKFNTSLKTLM